MKVLFIGGSGIISSACSALAVESGIDLFLLNRGQTSFRPIPAAAHVIHADIRDPAAAAEALHGQTFDAVVDWIAFTPDHVGVDLALFRGRVGQFVFISSASAYQKPPQRLPITEETPLDNPFWQYSRNKIACEELLMAAYRDEGFPCLLYTSDAADERSSVDLGGRRIIKKKNRVDRRLDQTTVKNR